MTVNDAVQGWYYGVGQDSFEAEFNAAGAPTGAGTHGDRIIWRPSKDVGCSQTKCNPYKQDPTNPGLRIVCHFGDDTATNQGAVPGDTQNIIQNLGDPLGHTNMQSGTVPPGTKPTG